MTTIEYLFDFPLNDSTTHGISSVGGIVFA